MDHDYCAWGQLLPSTGEVQTSGMFLASGCPNTADPDPNNIAGSSFCRDCASTSTPPPTSEPTMPSTSTQTETLLPISSILELLNATDAYLEDRSPTSDVALMYGHPIGSWNVSLVTNFSSIFNAERNPLASTFDDDLSGWDTSAAESMEQTFFLASRFNGDVSTWSTGRVTTMNSICKFLLFANVLSRSRWGLTIFCLLQLLEPICSMETCRRGTRVR